MSDTLPHFRYGSRRVGALVLIAFGIFVIAVLQAGLRARSVQVHPEPAGDPAGELAWPG